MAGEPPNGTAEGVARAVRAMAAFLGTQNRLPLPGSLGGIIQILCLLLVPAGPKHRQLQHDCASIP